MPACTLHALEHTGGYASVDALRVAATLLPDILHFDPTLPASFTKANDQAEGFLTKFKAEIAVLGTDQDGDEITTAIISADPCGSVDSKSSKRAKLTQTERRALDMLTKAVVDVGKDPPPSSEFPWKIKVVPIETWRTYCERGGLSESDTDAAFRMAFKRVTISLANKHRIGILDGHVWIAFDEPDTP